MTEVLRVTPAQVLAAQLSIELAEEDGETPDPALVAIANAEVVEADQSDTTRSVIASDVPVLDERESDAAYASAFGRRRSGPLTSEEQNDLERLYDSRGEADSTMLEQIQDIGRVAQLHYRAILGLLDEHLGLLTSVEKEEPRSTPAPRAGSEMVRARPFRSRHYPADPATLQRARTMEQLNKAIHEPVDEQASLEALAARSEVEALKERAEQLEAGLGPASAYSLPPHWNSYIEALSVLVGQQYNDPGLGTLFRTVDILVRTGIIGPVEPAGKVEKSSFNDVLDTRDAIEKELRDLTVASVLDPTEMTEIAEWVFRQGQDAIAEIANKAYIDYILRGRSFGILRVP